MVTQNGVAMLDNLTRSRGGDPSRTCWKQETLRHQGLCNLGRRNPGRLQRARNRRPALDSRPPENSLRRALPDVEASHQEEDFSISEVFADRESLTGLV